MRGLHVFKLPVAQPLSLVMTTIAVTPALNLRVFVLVLSVIPCLFAGAAEPPAAASPPAGAVDPTAAPPAGAASAGETAPPVDSTTAAPASAGSATVGPEADLLAAYKAGQLTSDVVELGGDSAPFLARYLPADSETPAGAVLFLPALGRFVTADPVAAAQLREFAGTDWAILAPQLPLLMRTAELSAYAELEALAVERVRAALDHLVAQGYTHVVMVGADSGATLLRRCLTENVSTGVGAIAVLGSWDGVADDLKFPVLEILAERDEAARTLAQARKIAARKAGKADYEQLTMAAAGRGFAGYEDDVASRLHGWARRVFAELADAAPSTRESKPEPAS